VTIALVAKKTIVTLRQEGSRIALPAFFVSPSVWDVSSCKKLAKASIGVTVLAGL
jgi:hypothetical protein